jgi:hypothetical protein
MISLSRERENRNKKQNKLTVFLLHDPRLELDVPHDREQCVRQEYGRYTEGAHENGEYVGLYADHLGCGCVRYRERARVRFSEFQWFVVSKPGGENGARRKAFDTDDDHDSRRL